MITISRIYVVDEDETCIQCASSDAQAALRAVEAAAEQIGARPKPGSFAPAKATRAPRKGKEEPIAATKPTALLPAGAPAAPPQAEATPPPLPAGTAMVFPQTTPWPQGSGAPAEPYPGVRLSDTPPVPLGQSYVGLAAPPSFGSPPSPEEILRKDVEDQVALLYALIPVDHPWRSDVVETVTGLRRQHGPSTAETLSQLRQYEDVLRKALQ